MKDLYVAEPFRIKSVEPLKILTKRERSAKIQKAGYNLFGLASEDVYIDLLTDSGTNAMSAEQWAGVMVGDESYAGAKSSKKLVETSKEIFGYKMIQMVHQGRAAEKIVMPIFLGKGKYSISNMHFDTTRAHVEMAGGRALDCIVPEAFDTTSYFDFKGNMDISRLEGLINEYGAENIGVIIVTVTNNSAGGQPVSLENMRQTSEVARKYRIPMLIDAARYAENAYFIKTREKSCAGMSIPQIIREMFATGDIFTMSAKKDAIVNMGGLIGVKENEAIFDKVKQRCISFEGFLTYGGMSGRDIEAMAIGLKEGIDFEYLRYRVGQIEYLGERLMAAGIPFQYPVGGHAMFIDAKRLLPHIPYHQFPAHALAVELYVEAGIRSCDVGSYMLGNDPDTGKQIQAQFEFTRLAIPRRVYTKSHMDVIADALINIKKRAAKIKGYKIEIEPPILRHFTAVLKPVE